MRFQIDGMPVTSAGKPFMLAIYAVQVCARCGTKSARGDDESAAAHTCNITSNYDFSQQAEELVDWLVGVVLVQRQLWSARIQNSNTSMHVETSELP